MRTNKYTIFLLMIFLFSCEQDEVDSSPFLIITNPENDAILYENIFIRCSTDITDQNLEMHLINDNQTSIKIGELVGPDWEFIFNSLDDNNDDGEIDYPDGNYSLVVSNIETPYSGDTIKVAIDNTLGIPDEVNIVSVVLINIDGDENYGTYEITWETSGESDFFQYAVEVSENYENFDSTFHEVHLEGDISINTYVYVVEDPSITRYFRIRTDDTFGLSSYGDIISDLGAPSKIEINSITLNCPDSYYCEYLIEWQECEDENFQYYLLEVSTDSENFDDNYEIIHNQEDISKTTFTYNTENPDILKYFRVRNVDILGRETVGPIAHSSEIKIPEILNIYEVKYDTTNFYITWEKSKDPRFHHYELKCNNPQYEGANSNEIFDVIYDINDTSLVVTGFTPVDENWFYVRQVDSSGLRPDWQADYWESFNNPFRSKSRLQTLTENEDYQVRVQSINYDLYPNTMTWSESPDPFFHAYELQFRSSETAPDIVPFDTVYNRSVTTSEIIDYDFGAEWNQYLVSAIDFWGVKTWGDPGLNYEIEPVTPSNIIDTSYDIETGGLTITWSISDNPMFHSYELITTDQTLLDPNYPPDHSEVLFATTDPNQNIFTIENIQFGDNQEIIFSPNANFIYLYVQITDVLGNTFLPASGITLSGPEPIRLFYGQYFNGSTKAKWETTEQEGFYSYTLYQSEDEDMNNSNAIFSTYDQTIDSVYIPNIQPESIHYYQIGVIDTIGFQTLSNINVGTGWSTFSETYNVGQDQNFRGRVFQTNDEGYLICSNGRLIKMNMNLEISWSTYDIFDDIKVMNDGNLLVVKENSIGKISITDGFYMWNNSNIFEDLNDFSRSITELNNGNIIAVKSSGFGNNGRTSLYRFDENGEFLYQNEFVFNELNFPNNVITTQDGGILITGRAADDSLGIYLGFIHKVNENNSTEWYKVLDYEGNQIIETNNRYVVDLHNDEDHMIMLLSFQKDNGDVIMSQNINSHEHRYATSSITKRINSNEFYLTHLSSSGQFWPTGSETDGIEMIRFDENLNVIVRNHIGDDWEYIPYDNLYISPALDGSIVLSTKVIRSSEEAIWISKIDPYGNSPIWGSHNYE